MGIRKEIFDNFIKGKIDPLTFLKANVQLSNLIEKAHGGEGSRGGKVIGHTRSGKPIYESYYHPEHNSFDHEDHDDARQHHNRALNELANRLKAHSYLKHTSGKDAKFHDAKMKEIDDAMEHHANASLAHEKKMFDLKFKNRLRRGDKVMVKNTGAHGKVGFHSDGQYYVRFPDGSDGHFHSHHLTKL